MIERSQREVWRLTPWLTLALLLINFILMAYDARNASDERLLRVWVQTVANFVQSPVSVASSATGDFFRSFYELRAAQEENVVLKQKVERLEFELLQRTQLTDENDRLKALLDLKNESDYKVLPARIISRDPTTWFDTILLNRGSLDGVKLNSPVVSGGGLVGRVTAVSPLSSQVSLISNSRAGVGGIIGELGSSNAIGVVSGNGKSDVLEMGYVPGTIQIAKGETVYSTGQDGIYPAGLKIGQVVDVKQGSSTEPHMILLKSAVRFDNLREVAILFYTPPQRQQFQVAVPNAVGESKAQ